MIRRYGPPPLKHVSYTTRHGVYAIILRGQTILCTLQESPQVEIQLPGGGIDPGETPLPALHREVQEETGWAISKPTKIGVFRRFTFMPEYDLWAEKVCHIYLAQAALRRSEPTEKGHHAVWLPLESAEDALRNEGDQDIVAGLVLQQRRRKAAC